MNTQSTKRILSVVLLIMVAVFAFSFISCDNGSGAIGGNSVSEIYIEKSDMPRQLYVQGQALEIQGGVLTTVVNGEKALLPLTEEGITVSGYDPNTIGNQTVTVTYKEQTTTYPVTVIARAVAENYEANYFVGDAFNKAKGKLRLAKDNAETFVVNMSDPSVTVTSFDSSKSGEKTVSVSYVKDGVTYNCSFNVTFHEAAEIKFVAPKKTSYTNSDTELNLSGGYLTVKAASPSNLTKNVTLTQAMVSGYRPEDLDISNRYTPVQQTITVSYGGQTWTYNVKITFSGISVVNELAKELTDLDWSKTEAPTLTDEQKEAAIDAMETYLDLAPADQELINSDTLAAIIKAATVAAQDLYIVELNKLAGAFMLDFSSGSLMIVGNTYDDIKNAAEELDDPDAGFNRYSAILRAIKSAYPTMQLYIGEYVTNYVVTHGEAANETIVPLLEHMMKVYNTMKDIPEEWDLEILKANEMKILDTVNIILLSNYKGNSYMPLYNPITNWRADFFEIIYTYYYEVKEGGKQDIQNKLWGNIPAPGLVYTWYTTFMSAYNETYILAQNTESGKAILYDTSKFFYYYNLMHELAAQIKNGEGTAMDKGIYELLNGDVIMEYYVRCSSTGYLGLMGGALNDKAIADLWAAYLPIYAKYMSITTQEQYSTFFTDNKEAMEPLFDMFVAMTPAQQHSFLSSLNYLYNDTRGAKPLFDYTTTNTASSMFVACIINTGRSNTPDSTHVMLQNMYLAIEYYSLRNHNSKALDNFIAAMEVVINAEGVSEDDKTAFFAAYGIQNWYNKYKAIYDAVKDPASVTVSDILSAKLDELNSWMDKYDEILNLIYTTDTSTEEGKMKVNYAYPLLFAIYDKIDVLKSELEQIEGYELAYIAKEYTLMDGKEEVSFTIDVRYHSAKLITVNFMLGNAMGDKLVWDLHTAELADLLAQIVDVMYAEFNGVAYEGDIYTIMNIFKSTSAETKFGFFAIQGTQLLYGAIERYMTANLPAELLETGVVRKLMEADIYYWVFMNNSEDYNALATFRTNIEAVTDIYNGLNDTTAFDTVAGDLYTFLTGEYDDLSDIEIPETPEDNETEAA